MLYRAQTVQLIIYATFQILPVFIVLCFQLIWYLGVGTAIRSELYAVIGLAFTSTHSFFDYFSILYFIRPYRQFTAHWLRWLYEGVFKCRRYVGVDRRISLVGIQTTSRQRRNSSLISIAKGETVTRPG